MAKGKLTSVQINEELYNKFKIQCLKDNFNLKKLVEYSILYYLEDKEYREKIRSTKIDQ